jgi:hypothetical protein
MIMPVIVSMIVSGNRMLVHMFVIGRMDMIVDMRRSGFVMVIASLAMRVFVDMRVAVVVVVSTGVIVIMVFAAMIMATMPFFSAAMRMPG